MPHVRRDLLMKKVAAGKMLARTSYSYDGRHVTIEEECDWMPARIVTGGTDVVHGFYNLYASDFKTKSGHATGREDGTFVLWVHGSFSVALKPV